MNHNATGLDEKGIIGYPHKRRCGHSPRQEERCDLVNITALDSVGRHIHAIRRKMNRNLSRILRCG